MWGFDGRILRVFAGIFDPFFGTFLGVWGVDFALGDRKSRVRDFQVKFGSINFPFFDDFAFANGWVLIFVNFMESNQNIKLKT